MPRPRQKVTAAEKAAQMKASGASVEDIAGKFGWTLSTAASMCSRGKNIDAFRERHKKYQRATYSKIEDRHA